MSTYNSIYNDEDEDNLKKIIRAETRSSGTKTVSVCHKTIESSPVTDDFLKVYGDNPSMLPIPESAPILGVKPPKYADDGTAYRFSDNSVWVYKGISVDDEKNKNRVNGWEKIK